ncbi:hypothetical protein FKG94_21150 [Exilibacterium tricleocarpae]|uniref:Glycosyl transferase family 28 C-terminal domain-containing protein n=1 Tax=Exilibacterium tricleocarpae TaxID=2591008 RepID=A0A545SZZ0_9GAMM|nr:glycosyltransferase [Exilibacterium tricleocarpae]TQV70532.1 hypothetical protein FKG94_21150 [Exilibacterium tricleocarpae]
MQSHQTSTALSTPLLTGPLRVLLYSHDSWGLGHLRRSLAIAGAITGKFSQANALVVTGSPCATQFPLPARCDLIKLPAVTKDTNGDYQPRSLSGPLEGTLALRSRILLEAFRGFAPNVVIIDHQLIGLHGEALPLLREAHATGVRTIYGMRDILDEPVSVQRSWNSQACRQALSTLYDCVCIYGNQEVFDSLHEYPALRRLAKRLEFTGYVVPSRHRDRRSPIPHLRKQVLVTVGGGEDGRQRIDKYLAALALAPCDWDSHIFTGPLMEPALSRHYKQEARRLGRQASVQVHRFHANLPRLLDEADVVVSMAGYNSCAEILQSGCRGILLPRTFPRREQAIRAQRLAKQGFVDALENPSTKRLRKTIERALNRGARAAVDVNLDGLSRICDVVSELTGVLPPALSPDQDNAAPVVHLVS